MQINLKREKEIMLQERLRAKRVAAEANGDVFEAESINLASAGNPHGDYSAEALLAQQNVESMDGWAQSYEDALNDGIVRTPQEFAEKVDRGELSIGGRTGGRGRKISLANNMTDQITMTKTQATVGVPSEYQGLSMSGEVERHGEIVAQKRNMSNFNTMNTGMPVDESFVESIDLEQDESQYEMNKRMKYEGVANQQKMINRRE